MNKFAIIVSQFNSAITHALLQGALQRFTELAITKDQITIFYVPGAVEIPLTAQLIAKKQQHQAIICLGAVIRGETGHYDLVCDQVSQGCQRIMLDYSIPILFGVLTTENDEQAQERSAEGKNNKGREAVDAAIHMVKIVESLT